MARRKKEGFYKNVLEDLEQYAAELDEEEPHLSLKQKFFRIVYHIMIHSDSSSFGMEYFNTWYDEYRDDFDDFAGDDDLSFLTERKDQPSPP